MKYRNKPVINDALTVQISDLIMSSFKILVQPEWAPQACGPLCFAHAAQSIATPLINLHTEVSMFTQYEYIIYETQCIM